MKYFDTIFIRRFFPHYSPVKTIIRKIQQIAACIILILSVTNCSTLLPPLHKAVYNGDINATTTELDKGTGVNETFSLESPLMAAAYYGYIDIVKLLLDRGADVNYTNGRLGGWYDALSRAVTNCHLDVIKLLLDRGAKVEQRHIIRAKEDCDAAVLLLTEAQLKQLNKKPGDKPKTTKKEAADML